MHRILTRINATIFTVSCLLLAITTNALSNDELKFSNKSNDETKYNLYKLGWL